MASAKTATKRPVSPQVESDRSDRSMEQNVIAFAEKVGFLMGTVQARTEGWLDRERLSSLVGQIRDSAAHLLEQVNAQIPSRSKLPRSKASGSSAARARGPVDAPGKRHRKPPPQESVNKSMGKAKGDRLTEKGLKTGRFRRRG